MQARQRIVDRSKTIGLDFEGEVKRLETEADWDALLAEATDPNVAMPTYYTQPFHAYDMGSPTWHVSCCVPGLLAITKRTAKQAGTPFAGNLCWAAAMEFEVASRSVHCSVLDDTPDPQVFIPLTISEENDRAYNLITI
jgi:hypothetical protein